MTTAEEWRPVPSHPKISVSSMGRVRGPSGNLMKVWGRRYPTIKTSCEPRKTLTIHTCVAEAFIGPRPPGMEVAHLNGDGFDCRLENLAYVTPVENASHKIAHGTQIVGDAHKNAKLTADMVREIRRRSHENKWDLADEFGVHRGTIEKIISGRLWRHLLNDQPARGHKETLYVLRAKIDQLNAALTEAKSYDPTIAVAVDLKGNVIIKCK